MNRNQAEALSKVNDSYISEAYKLIAGAGIQSDIAGDECIQLDATHVDELSNLAHQHVKARYIERYGRIDTAEDARNDILIKIAGDTLTNPKNKVGTLLDPNVYTHSNIPVVLGPYEGSSVYSPGGLPATIIDKKFKGMVIQGATFKAYDDNEKFWDADKIQRLEDASFTTGFNDAIMDAVTDAAVYGGGIIYPVFNKGSYLTDLDKLGLEKGCIQRWVTVDRWNTVIVPNYVVTAKDYLKPKRLYISQSALDINTDRIALVKPKPEPYWVYLYNLGWCPSDLSGWLRSYYGYEITCQSIPVMAQQMSLLLYKMPLDGLNATIGPENVKKLMEINEEKMSEWSALSPKAVNMIGDVEVVNRTYSGFEQFVGAMKSDLAAQCGLPEPVLWHTPNKGFSDNTTESLLKQSEQLQMLQRFIERSMEPCTKALIAHVFGQDSEEYKRANLVRMSFSKPVISTEKDLAEVGARFAASVNSFVQAGVSPDTAIQLSAQFFPSVKITQELLNQARQSYEEVMDRQDKLSQPQVKGTLGGGVGNTKGKTQNTGAYTK